LEKTMIRSSASRNPVLSLMCVFFLSVLAVPAAVADEVVALKNALYGAGYEINNVSPQMDAATRSALESYQDAQGLMVTGELDGATRSALGLGGVNLASGSSSSAPVSSAPAASNQASTPEA